MSDSSSMSTCGESNQQELLYKVRFTFHGPSIYQRKLYDVDGNLIVTSDGSPLHMHHPEIKKAFEDGLRVIHCVHPGYRYFVQSDQQLNRFRKDRQEGTLFYKRYYHVYNDEDMTEHPLKRKRTYCILSKA